jgi:hypothetical protein
VTARSARRLVWLALAVAIGLYVVQALVGRGTLTDARLAAVGCIFKLAFQLSAAVICWSNAGSFEPGNPSRTAWRSLSLACLALFLGQLWYAPYQLTLRRAPFPSLADAFFSLSYPLLFVALWSFLRAYTHAGMVPLSPAQLRWLAAATVAIVVAVGFWVLKPLVSAPAAGLEYALNLFYPGFDLVLLVPIVLLFRFSLAMRGGHVWRVWLALLGGVVGLAVGDVAFSFLQNLGMSHLEPVLHVMFLAAYGLLVQAALFQREVLGE